MELPGKKVDELIMEHSKGVTAEDLYSYLMIDGAVFLPSPRLIDTRKDLTVCMVAKAGAGVVRKAVQEEEEETRDGMYWKLMKE